MNLDIIEIILTAWFIAVSATVPGVFLAVQRKTLLADAAAHSVLLGIILAFLLVQTFASFWLFAAATLSALAALLLAEKLSQLRAFLPADAAMVISFAFSFSLALILINRSSAQNIHLDEDVVILGELAFTPFLRTEITESFSISTALLRSGGMLLFTLMMMFTFWRKWAVVSFDPTLAHLQGISIGRAHLLLVALASLNAIQAMEYVGLLIAIAFFALPAGTGLLLGRTLASVTGAALLSTCVTIPTGYLLAYLFQASISGCMALAMGAGFLLAALRYFLRARFFAPLPKLR